MKSIFTIIGCLLLCASCAALPPRAGKRGLIEQLSAPPPPRNLELTDSRNSTCRRLNGNLRRKLLSLADPENFPRTRYRRGPRAPGSIERETDCSHFVHEVYRRAGLPYSYRTSHQLKNAPEFQVLPEREARPGDLMLFRGHVGIIDQDGRIISATRTRGKKSSITRMERSNFPGIRGRRYVLRYRCAPNDEVETLATNP